jgi:SlyX protein
MPNTDTDKRLMDLEVKASFTEDLVEQLNQTIFQQQQQIDALIREVSQLRQQRQTADRVVSPACATSCHRTTDAPIKPMTEAMQTPPAYELGELVLSTLYKLSAYAITNLIDDAAMLSIVFI